MAKVDQTRYSLRGKLGDGEQVGDYGLGDELVVVCRAVVTKVADHYVDGQVVADTTCTVLVAHVIEAGQPGFAANQKLLARANAQEGRLL